MNSERRYPETVSGPFEEPPIQFNDRDGRDIEIRPYDSSEPEYEALAEMYVEFDPSDRAQGIPPGRESRVRTWLDGILADDCYNLIAWDGDTAAGDDTATTAHGSTSDGAGSVETATASEAEADAAKPVDPSDEASWVVDDITTESPSTPAVDASAEPVSTDGDQTTPPASDLSTATSSPTDSDDSTTNTVDDDLSPHAHPEAGDTTPTQPTTQQTLTGETTTAERRYDSLPSLRVLGQLYDTYLLAATDDGLLLIDQHAADERINYERLHAELGDAPATQTLAEPVSLELTAREAALFESVADRLAAIGFRAENAGDREVTVTGVPAVFNTTLAPELLGDALLGVVDAAEGDTVEAAIDELLADLACYPSVTGNTSLTEGSVVDLLSALDGCENPYACPHGRPVLIEITREEISDRFERDYPGHGRRQE